MKPMYAFLLTFLFVSSCEPVWAFSKKAQAPEPAPSSQPTPASTVVVEIDPGPTVSPWPQPLIEVEQIMGATDAEMRMIDEGTRLANEAVKSPCFRQWVRAARYSENNNLTQAAIDDLIQTRPSLVKVEMYTGGFKANHVWKTVGYETDPYDGWVHMNRYFVKTARQVADNLLHEDRGHYLGFRHDGNHGTSEPYGMNYAYEGCSMQMQQGRGARKFKPPGIRLEIRKTYAAKTNTPKVKKKKAHAHSH